MSEPIRERNDRALVAEHFRSLREPGLGRPSDAEDLVLSPDGRFVAFTALVFEAVDRDAVRAVHILDIESGELTAVGSRCAQTYGPQWSAAGDRLAWIGSDGGRSVVELSCWPLAKVIGLAAAGSVEYLQWSPDGSQLLLGVAEDGAEQSDALGSGRLPAEQVSESWTPQVSTGAPSSGWRSVWSAGLNGRDLERLTPQGLNVWQAAWAGDDALVCVTSSDSSESGWYDARLSLVGLDGTIIDLAMPTGQLGLPGASPSGDRLSVVVGSMSDRGIYVGDVAIVDRATHAVTFVRLAGIDVTAVVWCGEDQLLLAGLAGTETVLLRYELEHQQSTEIWRTAEGTCGALLPTCAGTESRVVAVCQAYGVTPVVTLFNADGTHTELLKLGNAGTDQLARIGGTLRTVRWLAADGLEIEGFLVVPDGPRPHPLVVHVHGGPVWAWRNEWSMHYPYTPLLASLGYAVLHVNARGSAGRGQAFVTAGLTDMGAADATDLTSGVELLVAQGLVDPRRVGIMGNSYGGFMTAWLLATSNVFAAGVARSPVTEWVSQHYASNIPGFDGAFVSGDPLDPDSHYRSRSPLLRVAEVRAPILLIAGALDLATPPEQALMFHRALVERGADSTLVIYPEEGHGIRRHGAMVDHLARMLAFFARHLPVALPVEPAE